MNVQNKHNTLCTHTCSRLLLLFLFLFAALSLFFPHAQAANLYGAYAENEVIVGLQPDINYSSGMVLATAYGASSVMEYDPRLNCMLIRVDNVEGFISEVKGASGIKYVEPNYLVRALYTPNDLYYGYQWALPAINASTAWDYEKGNASVKIAIVDTGIQSDHPDIASNYVSGGYDWVRRFQPL